MLQFLKLGLLLVSISLVQCLEQVRNDNLVPFNGSSKCFDVPTFRSKEPVADFFDSFAWNDFWKFLPLKGGPECKAHTSFINEEAKNLNLWALKILDASAKTPSGILNGNLNQLGDFDECLSSKGIFQNQILKGKYCLASINLIVKEKSKKNVLLDSAIHSHRMLRNELKDPGHRIPKFETFNWGVCVPSSCSSEDIKEALQVALTNATERSSFYYEVYIDDEVCYVSENEKFSVAKLGVICLFCSIFMLIVAGTYIDVHEIIFSDYKLNSLLRCFSLKRNWSLLLKTETSGDDIKFLHGARFLNAIALLLSHKQIAMLFYAMPNRTQMAEGFGKPWTMIGRAAILYTDSFIMFSGLLASYSLIKDLDNKRKINFKEKLINRFVRFTPNLLAIILFCTYIMESMNSGPQWGLLVTKYSNLCKKYMWRNLLYIHNYFGFENMCLTHTHQLGIDMQLFLLSFAFIYLLWKSPKLGSFVLIVAAAASTWLRYRVTYQENLSTLLYFGISVERLWKTANSSYILPSHRLTVYLMGIFMGYYLRRGGKSLNLNYTTATIGWIISTAAILLAVFQPYEASYVHYTYNVVTSSDFNAFNPVLWTSFLCWVLIASVNGWGGLFADFLSWKYFVIFTRISYALYLTQFPIFFYNVGAERSVRYFNGFFSLIDIAEFTAIFIASIILTLTIDIPFQELKKVLMKNSDKKEEDRNENIVHPVEAVNGASDAKNRKRRVQPFGT